MKPPTKDAGEEKIPISTDVIKPRFHRAVNAPLLHIFSIPVSPLLPFVHGIPARTTPASDFLVLPCSAPQTGGLGDAPFRTGRCKLRSRSTVCTCRCFASLSRFPEVSTGFTCFSGSQFTGSGGPCTLMLSAKMRSSRVIFLP